MWCRPFFSDEKPFTVYVTVFKIVARWRYDWCSKSTSRKKNQKSKSEKMGAKFVRTTSTIQKRAERIFTTAFYHMYGIVDVHSYKNISLPRYRVPQKNCQLVAAVTKAHVRTNVCAHRKSIKPLKFQKCFGAFYRGFLQGMICSCALMFKFFSAPPDGATTQYQISNREFSDFLRTLYCEFLSNVYIGREVFLL